MAISQDPTIEPETEYDRALRDAFVLTPAPGTMCFYCFEPVVHPAIYWVGADHLWLHAECAAGLCRGLLADVRRLGAWSELRSRKLAERQIDGALTLYDRPKTGGSYAAMVVYLARLIWLDERLHRLAGDASDLGLSASWSELESVDDNIDQAIAVVRNELTSLRPEESDVV